MVKLFLESGANVDVPDYQGRTPLHLAEKYSRHIVRLLLDYGAGAKGIDTAKRPKVSEELRRYFSEAPYCSFVDGEFRV